MTNVLGTAAHHQIKSNIDGFFCNKFIPGTNWIWPTHSNSKNKLACISRSMRCGTKMKGLASWTFHESVANAWIGFWSVILEVTIAWMLFVKFDEFLLLKSYYLQCQLLRSTIWFGWHRFSYSCDCFSLICSQGPSSLAKLPLIAMHRMLNILHCAPKGGQFFP